MEAIRKDQSKIHLREQQSVRGCPPAFHLAGSSTFRTPVGSLEQLRELISFGSAARAVGTTTLNERSSRSHAVITLHVHSKLEGSAVIRTGKLHLVDLAGSEALTTGVESVLTAETRAINVSLTALCDVLQALSKNGRARGGAPQQVPYRNHKLTRLLSDSLGGNSHTLMIAAVQADHVHFRSTLTTLKYASRARDITQHAENVNSAAVANGLVDADAPALRAKIADLQGRLARREEEIERLESLQSAREVMMGREHERQLAELRAGKAQEQGDLQVELSNLKVHSAAEVAMAQAEHDFLTSSIEMETLVQMMVRGLDTL